MSVTRSRSSNRSFFKELSIVLKSCETRSVEPYTRWFQVVFGVFFLLGGSNGS